MSDFRVAIQTIVRILLAYRLALSVVLANP